MRKFIQKFGQRNLVIFITLISILLSILLTYLIFYLKQDFRTLSTSIIIATVVPLIVAPGVLWPLVSLLIKIDRLESEMRRLATYDSLTGLLTRRAFFHDANAFISFAEREQIPFSVITLDLDKFKNINDSYGHPGGDEVLKHFAMTAKSILRKGDLIGRIGGEEFALLLPNTSEEAANTFSERLHNLIRELTVIHDELSIKFTISMGLVSLLPNVSYNIENILKDADKSLYLAKEKGRNCTMIFNANKANSADAPKARAAD